MNIITVERKVLAKNDEIAAQNRALFRTHKLFVINIVSSPGSGKTRPTFAAQRSCGGHAACATGSSSGPGPT